MREFPIIFNASMVRAILDGSKTQTRRGMNPQPIFSPEGGAWYPRDRFQSGGKGKGLHYGTEAHFRKGAPIDWCPYGQPGDRLWVRETFNHITDHCYQVGECGVFTGEDHGVYSEFSDNGLFKTHFAADHGEIFWEGGWKPSIFMPRWASRITLEVTGVRVERVQDISEYDAKMEGIERAPGCFDTFFDSNGVSISAENKFRYLWDSINAERGFGWDTNPWVWVINFKGIK